MANMTFKANLLPNTDLGYNLGSSSLRWKLYGTLEHVTLNSTTIDSTAGTFAFSGSGAPYEGCDWVGLQIGNNVEKFQIMCDQGSQGGAGSHFSFRFNDSGGTDSTGWTDWQTYVNRAGDSMLGHLLIGSSGAGGYLNGDDASNGGCNSILIGDDVWLGDVNVAGLLGLKAAASSTTVNGFLFKNGAGTEIGRFYADGTQIVSTKDLTPNAVGSIKLGTSTLPWKKLFLGKGDSGIQPIGQNYSSEAISFLDTSQDSYGLCVRIGAGGLTVVGAGESSTSLISTASPSTGAEDLYLVADSQIFIESNCNSIADRKGIKMYSGSIIPVAAETDSDATQNLGSTSARWNRVFTHGVGQDAGMTIQAGHSNEVNFGGTFNSNSIIFFGYRAIDSKSIPSTFVFGGSTGTADIKCNSIYLANGTENRLTYFNSSKQLLPTPGISYFRQNNNKSAQQTILHIQGQTYGNDAAYMTSGTAGLFQWGDGGPQITFDTSTTPGGGQAGALIFTDHDTAAAGASFHFVSNQSDWNVTSKRFHAKTNISIGTNLPNTSYNLYCNGNAYFTNSIDVNRSTYSDGGSRIKLTSGSVGVGLHVGSGGTNRGIYDWGVNNWLIYCDGTNCRSGLKIYGAVWNDYAEYRETKEEIEPGKCVREVGDGTLILTTERLQAGCEIVSDTFGFAIGQSKKANTPTAASGRVLAYCLEGQEEARNHIGEPVCSGPNGTVSIMTHEEEKEWPSRIIGTISEIPSYNIWIANDPDGEAKKEIQVNGRIWIRIR